MDANKISAIATFDNYDLDIPTDVPDMGNTHYLLVYPVAIEAKTQGGLLLDETQVDSVQKLMSFGKVVSKGKMCYLNNVCKHPITGEYLHWCEKDDWVVWSRLSEATAVLFAGKKFWVIPDINILYKIEDPRRIDPRYRVVGMEQVNG